ncbi:hypothetical protein LIER_42131 [Lithospermum erythrorhizon]|uniref:Uncharacterized protein n=1 Tax=Lithospermum erythrorhizon TaxID=34254 RepID=A0AAV3RL57_LITER
MTVPTSGEPIRGGSLYDSGCVSAGAMESVAEEILQTTITDLSRLIRLYDLTSIRSKLADKMFLVLLRRTYSRTPGGSRRLHLVAFL